MKLDELPLENIHVKDMPIYHREGVTYGNTYIRFGKVKRGGNEPYCYVEEKQCEGHICRVLSPERTVDKALVIRDDGTIWKVYLSNFCEVHLLRVKKEG